jgi:hypothetical protein
MAPHAEPVIVAAGVLDPCIVIVDLSRRSVRSAAMTARLLEEMPGLPLVVLLDREANPDIKRRALDRGLERDRLATELERGLERAFGMRMRVVQVEANAPEDFLPEAVPGFVYSPTFNC